MDGVVGSRKKPGISPDMASTTWLMPIVTTVSASRDALASRRTMVTSTSAPVAAAAARATGKATKNGSSCTERSMRNSTAPMVPRLPWEKLTMRPAR